MTSRETTKEISFEDKLWKAADKLRNNVDAAEYKHVVLGLLFLKYISDAFEEVYKELKKNPESDPDERDEYSYRNVFWVPKEARWTYLASNAKKPEIGELIDSAMDAIERDNKSLRGVLVKNYARPNLSKAKLGELIDLVGTIGLGDKENRSKDILGRVYEYFLGRFADAEGKSGGQFYTPRSIVKLLVEMLEPYHGRILDPCCGSGGMFVQSEKFIEAHGGRANDVSIYGQESNQTTWRLCKMNLALRGIESGMVKWNEQGSFLNDEHKDLRADFIMANPPFNDSDWSGELLRNDARWKYGVPPIGNANFAWVQHFINHLSPNGAAGFVLAMGSLSSNAGGEGAIRRKIVEDDIVDCIVALPIQLFYNTGIPACLWFVARDRKNHKFRDRSGEVLFIDAREMGLKIDRRHRELTDDDIKRISLTYHSWRGESQDKQYSDVPGFCRAATLKDIEAERWILTPGRYVGSETRADDTEAFEIDMKQLTLTLSEQLQEDQRLRQRLRDSLERIGYAV